MIYDPVANATRTIRLDVDTGKGDVAFSGKAGNLLPSVALLSPANNAVFQAGKRDHIHRIRDRP